MVLPVFNKRAIDFSWLREAPAEAEERREFRGLLELAHALADEGFALLIDGVLLPIIGSAQPKPVAIDARRDAVENCGIIGYRGGQKIQRT